MYKMSDLDKPFYRVHEVAVILGFSDKTIREYDKSGILKAERTEGNQRHFSKKELVRFLQERNLIEDNTRRDVVYVRIPSYEDSKNLDTQALSVIEKVSDLHNPLVIKEKGSVLDKRRPDFEFLVSKVFNNEIRNIYILHKNILSLHGFDYLDMMFQLHGTHIIAINKTKEEKAIEQLFMLLENTSSYSVSEFNEKLDSLIEDIKTEFKNY